jgi:hypothetical protein
MLPFPDLLEAVGAGAPAETGGDSDMLGVRPCALTEEQMEDQPLPEVLEVLEAGQL